MSQKQKLTLADLKQLGDEWNERGSTRRNAALSVRRELTPAQKLGQLDFGARPAGDHASMCWWGWL